jgi:hypothetical protein
MDDLKNKDEFRYLQLKWMENAKKECFRLPSVRHGKETELASKYKSTTSSF